MRCFALLVLVILMCVAGFAQEVPKVEVAGGYWGVFHSQDYDLPGNKDLKRHGWYASVVGNGNDVFGMEGAATGAYADGTSLYSFLGGPRVTWRETKGIAPYGHGLVGTARRSIGGTTQTWVTGRLGGGIALFIGNRLFLDIGADYDRSFRGLYWDEFTGKAGIGIRLGRKQ